MLHYWNSRWVRSDREIPGWALVQALKDQHQPGAKRSDGPGAIAVALFIFTTAALICCALLAP